VRLKRLDKKDERAAVDAHHAALAARLEATDEPSDALLLAVPLLCAQVRVRTRGHAHRHTKCLTYQ